MKVAVRARFANRPPAGLCSHVAFTGSVSKLSFPPLYISCDDLGATPLPHPDVTVPGTQRAQMPCKTSSSGKYPLFSFRWASTSAYPDSDAHFWDTIFSMDITSDPEVLSNVVTIVYSPTKVNTARSLQGEKAQSFIDLIDRVGDQGKLQPVPLVLIMAQLLTASPHLDQKPFRRCSRLLYKICKARGILPTSYVVGSELTYVGELGWHGGFADVSKGEHQGRSVAIKDLRIGAKDEFDKVFKVSSCAPRGA